MKGHVFKFNEMRRLNFRHQDIQSHLGAVIPEDIQHILHVPSSGNDFCLAEADLDIHGAWKHGPAGLPVVIASVNGPGEVRWAVRPTDIKSSLMDGHSTDREVKEHQAILGFFEITLDDVKAELK